MIKSLDQISGLTLIKSGYYFYIIIKINFVIGKNCRKPFLQVEIHSNKCAIWWKYSIIILTSNQGMKRYRCPFNSKFYEVKILFFIKSNFIFLPSLVTSRVPLSSKFKNMENLKKCVNLNIILLARAARPQCKDNKIFTIKVRADI